MHNLSLALQAAWKVLAVGVLLGAGLPAIFAAGVRALAYGQGGEAEVHPAGTPAPAPHPVGRLLAGLCFLVVLLAVALGITYIVATGLGKAVHFDHAYPTVVSKD